jgi:hypothetical protein
MYTGECGESSLQLDQTRQMPVVGMTRQPSCQPPRLAVDADDASAAACENRLRHRQAVSREALLKGEIGAQPTRRASRARPPAERVLLLAVLDAPHTSAAEAVADNGVDGGSGGIVDPMPQRSQYVLHKYFCVWPVVHWPASCGTRSVPTTGRRRRLCLSLPNLETGEGRRRL